MAFGCVYGGECTGCMECQDEAICSDCGGYLDNEGRCPDCDYEEEEYAETN